MTDGQGDRDTRTGVATLLAAVTVAVVCGRILGDSHSSHGENDRSRWATVRALGDEGTYAVGSREAVGGGYVDRGIVFERGWDTIDKVLRPETSRFYSSKPPLFPTTVAAVYMEIKCVTGLSLAEDHWAVTRCVLLAVNALPLLIYLHLLGRLVGRASRTSWGAGYLVAAGCFGTLVTAFSPTLNNHTPAALLALASLCPAVDILGSQERASASRYAVCGFFVALAAAVDLPAAAMAAGLGVILVRHDARRTLVGFVPAATVPVAAFALTNYLAIGQITPAYGEFGGPWYEYDGSAWLQKAGRGIDSAGLAESKWEYAFHLTAGHHGLFSLTPIFLLAFAGGRLAWAGAAQRGLTLLAWGLTPVVLAFYVIRTSNYGGVCCGARWLVWLTPVYLLAMVPAADRLGQTVGGRLLGYGLLAVSTFTASYPGSNPWSHPWLYDLFRFFGWANY